MFERYTEQARRAIFFARYESSQFGAAEITVEHFLLGVLREDREIAAQVPLATIRKRIEQQMPALPKISTSVDLPLSDAMKRVLAFGSEAAERTGEQAICTRHHLLGILREPSLAADLLREYGLTQEVLMAGAGISGSKPKAAIFESSLRDLQEMIQATAVGEEALAHLIDCATGFQQWLAQALAGGTDGFQPPPLGRLSEYCKAMPRAKLFELWVGLNQMLVQVLSRIPEESAQGIAPAAEQYVKHCSAVTALGQ